MKLSVDEREALEGLGKSFEGRVLLKIFERDLEATREMQDNASDPHILFRAQGTAQTLKRYRKYLQGQSA